MVGFTWILSYRWKIRSDATHVKAKCFFFVCLFSVFFVFFICPNFGIAHSTTTFAWIRIVSVYFKIRIHLLNGEKNKAFVITDYLFDSSVYLVGISRWPVFFNTCIMDSNFIEHNAEVTIVGGVIQHSIDRLSSDTLECVTWPKPFTYRVKYDPTSYQVQSIWLKGKAFMAQLCCPLSETVRFRQTILNSSWISFPHRFDVTIEKLTSWRNSC